MIIAEQGQRQEKTQKDIIKTLKDNQYLNDSEPHNDFNNQLLTLNTNNLGHWTMEENLKYIVFLRKYKMKFKCKLRNKKVKLFEQMSNFIETRSTIQCRTHHQKFENKLGNIDAVIQDLKNKIGLKSLRNLPRQLSLLKKIIQNQVLDVIKKNHTQLNQSVQKVSIGVQTDEIFISLPQIFQNNFKFPQQNLNFVLFYPMIN